MAQTIKMATKETPTAANGFLPIMRDKDADVVAIFDMEPAAVEVKVSLLELADLPKERSLDIYLLHKV